MRIAIDSRMLSWSGIGRYNRELLAQLQKLDHENEYLVLLNTEDHKSWEPISPNFQKVLADFRPFSLGEQIGLRRLLYKLKPDVTHFTNFNAPLGYRLPCVVTIHDLNMLRYSSLQGTRLKRIVSRLKRYPARYVFKSICLRSRTIITPSLFVKKDLANFFGSQHAQTFQTKTRVTYEAANELGAEPKTVKHLLGKRFLLYVGNAYPNKNLNRLVTAFGELQKTEPDLSLVLVGKHDEFYQKLIADVTQRGIKQVLAPGFASDAQLAWLYQNTIVFITPSLSEGFGLPGLEAMAHGAPVLAANASCLPEVYGQAAIYFDPNDPTDMASVILKAINNPKTLAQLKAAGAKQASRYSWEEMAKQTLSVYKSTVV